MVALVQERRVRVWEEARRRGSAPSFLQGLLRAENLPQGVKGSLGCSEVKPASSGGPCGQAQPFPEEDPIRVGSYTIKTVIVITTQLSGNVSQTLK